VVTVEEADWTASGPSALQVELSGEGVHLPLPEVDVAVRVLRGHGWRRPEAPVRPGGLPGAEGLPAVHAPCLPGYEPVLLARGSGRDSWCSNGSRSTRGLPVGCAPTSSTATWSRPR
jgi:hypothetical protein